MKFVNRNAVMVKPGQPYREWIASLPGSSPDVAAGSEAECTVYLLPEIDRAEDFMVKLRRHAKAIFTQELIGWCTDEQYWPKKRDWRTFCAWFEFDFGSEVIDLGKRALEVEEM